MQESNAPGYHPIGQVYSPGTEGKAADVIRNNPTSSLASPASTTGGTQSSGSYELSSLDTPETTLEPQGAQNGGGQQHSQTNPPEDPRRKGMVKRAVIGSALLVTVVLLAILITTILSRRGTQLQSSVGTTPDQSVALDDNQASDKLPILGIADDKNKLIVNGNIVTQGSIYLASSNNYAQILSSVLTANQQYTLPNSSGTFCLDSNNCGYLTDVDVATTTVSGVEGAITLQGTANQINVNVAGQVITLSAPQDIATSSTPTFASIVITNVGTQNGSTICDSSNNCGFAPVADAFVQGGNSFGAAATLGTNDANSLSFETSGATQATIAVGGATTFQNSTDSTTAFQVLDADGGTPVLNVDTTNERVGIGTATPATMLDIVGDTQISTKAQIGAQASTIDQCLTIFGVGPCNAALEVAPAASTETGAAVTYGINSITQITPNGATNTLPNRGVASTLALTGTQSFSGPNISVDGFAANSTTAGTVTYLNGVTGYAFQGGAGSTVTELVGLRGGVAQAAGTVTTGYGLDVIAASGTFTNNYGVYVRAQTAGTSDYGIRVDAADTQTLWISGNADNTTAAAGIAFGSSRDTNLYRSAANVLRTDDVLSIGTLGTTDTASHLCYNLSSQLAACNSSGPGAAFVQGGNSFSEAATLGTNDTNSLSFETDGTTRMTIGTNGHIGLGNGNGAAIDDCTLLGLGTCSAVLNNQENITTFTSTNNIGINNNLLLSPSGAVATTSTGMNNFVQTQSANAQTFSAIRATRSAVVHNGTNTVSIADGIYADVTNNSSGAISAASAVQAVVSNASNGSMTSATGVTINVLNLGSGTIGTVRGISITAGNGGTNTVTTNYGIDVAYGTGNTGTITTNYGINVQSAFAVGTVTTNYGINVAAQTAGTSDYGVAIGAADTQTLWLSSNADNTTAAAGLAFGLSRDTNLYRSAANTLMTDDRFNASTAAVNSTGSQGTVEKLRVNTPTTVDNSANVMLATSATTSKGLVIQGAASQTANLQEWQDSSGSTLAYVSSAGRIKVSSTASAGLVIGTTSTIYTSADAGGLTIANTTAGQNIGILPTSTGNIYLGTTADTATIEARRRVNITGSTNALKLQVQGAAGQTADLQQWQNSGGTVLASVDNNGFLGIGADPAYSLDVLSSGADATTVAQFKNAGATSCTVQPGGTGFACSSDERLKTNIVGLDTTNALDTLSALNPVSFNWNSNPNGATNYGFLAQELQQLIPSAVSADANGYLVANYDAIIPYTVRGIQLQQDQLTTLDQRLTALESQTNTSQPQNLTNLNLSGTTTLDTLEVTGSTSIAGNLTVQGSVSIAGDLTVQGHIKGNQDTRGEVVIPAGSTEATYAFTTPYTNKPFVVASPTNKPVLYHVESTPSGFKVKLAAPDTTDTAFNFLVQQ